MRRFEEMDQLVVSFHEVAKIECLAGCGRCCESVHIETTIAEMLPMAAAIFDSGLEEAWFERLAAAFNRQCPAYSKTLTLYGGNCMLYPWRPPICRLFGSAAVRDKYGRLRPVVCREIRSARPGIVDEVERAILQGFPFPVFSNQNMALIDLLENHCRQQMPIGDALRLAMEKVGLYRSFAAENTDGKNSPLKAA